MHPAIGVPQPHLAQMMESGQTVPYLRLKQEKRGGVYLNPEALSELLCSAEGYVPLSTRSGVMFYQTVLQASLYYCPSLAYQSGSR
jgi:hypothetical protein